MPNSRKHGKRKQHLKTRRNETMNDKDVIRWAKRNPLATEFNKNGKGIPDVGAQALVVNS